MSTQRVDARMIDFINDKWDKQECQDLLEAMRVELKADLRKGAHRKYGEDIQVQLIDNIQNPYFWGQLQLLLKDFRFDY